MWLHVSLTGQEPTLGRDCSPANATPAYVPVRAFVRPTSSTRETKSAKKKAKYVLRVTNPRNFTLLLT